MDDGGFSLESCSFPTTNDYVDNIIAQRQQQPPHLRRQVAEWCHMFNELNWMEPHGRKRIQLVENYRFWTPARIFVFCSRKQHR